MADFNNLLGEIDNDEASNLDANVDISGVEIGDNDNRDQSQPRSQPANIPNALLEAEDQRRKELEADAADDDDIANDEMDGDILFPDEDYEALKQLWIREINTTELLQNEENLIADLIELLPEQEQNIEEFTEQAQYQSSAHQGNVDANLASLASSICKMDFERMCFLLADLKRTRMGKIEKYALHNREITERMSDEEVKYLKEYGQLFETHMRRSVTDQIPKEAWRKLDEPSMIDRPNLDHYVFCKVIDEEGVVLDNHKGLKIDLSEENADEEEEEPERHYDPGSFLFVRYDVVREFISEGKVNLLM